MGEIATLSELSTAKQSAWIDRLFDRMAAMYGARFADMWGGLDLSSVKSVWREELSDMSPDEISRGVAACRTRDWPPTLPEFVKLCRPAIDYERAFSEAVKQMQLRKSDCDQWSNPVVFWAAASIGSDLSNLPYSALKARWQNALDEAAEKVRSGQLPREVPRRFDALPSPGKTSVPKEEQMRRIAEVRKSIAEALSAKV